ncbi:hypothetical protein [Streptomyces murinus]|uniref:hypothetical protein n=1 Tax=Streptomyces murinus TaxID=33900 RepID=UPI0018F4F20F
MRAVRQVPLFDHPAVLHHHHDIGRLRLGEPVRHHDGGPALGHLQGGPVEGLGHVAARLGRRLVQHHRLGVDQQNADEGELPHLTDRQPMTRPPRRGGSAPRTAR